MNLMVIEELHRRLERSGGTLIVVDAVRYLEGGPELSNELREFCGRKGIGYLPLSDALLASERKGIPTHWKHDRHFNVAGNRLFGEAMYRWLTGSVGFGYGPM